MANKLYYTASEVAEMVGVGRTSAYESLYMTQTRVKKGA